MGGVPLDRSDRGRRVSWRPKFVVIHASRTSRAPRAASEHKPKRRRLMMAVPSGSWRGPPGRVALPRRRLHGPKLEKASSVQDYMVPIPWIGAALASDTL